jgi:hypothetical protein
MQFLMLGTTFSNVVFGCMFYSKPTIGIISVFPYLHKLQVVYPSSCTVVLTSFAWIPPALVQFKKIDVVGLTSGPLVGQPGISVSEFRVVNASCRPQNESGFFSALWASMYDCLDLSNVYLGVFYK